VLLLQYLRDGASVRRALTVLKTRATKNAVEVREFSITKEGIILDETIDSQPSAATS
jgi:hypothetical protein